MKNHDIEMTAQHDLIKSLKAALRAAAWSSSLIQEDIRVFTASDVLVGLQQTAAQLSLSGED